MALIKIKQIEGLNDTIDELQGEVSTNEDSITSNISSISNVELSIADNEDSITSNISSISNVELSIDDNISSISNVELSIADNEDSIADNISSISNAELSIADNEDSITSNISSITSNINSISNAELSIGDNEESIENNSSVLSSVSNEFIDSVQSIEEQFVPEPYTIDTFNFSDASVTEITGQRLSVGLTQNVEDESPGNIIYVTVNGIVTPVGDVSGSSISTKSLGYSLENDDSIEIKYTAEHGT